MLQALDFRGSWSPACNLLGWVFLCSVFREETGAQRGQVTCWGHTAGGRELVSSLRPVKAMLSRILLDQVGRRWCNGKVHPRWQVLALAF